MQRFLDILRRRIGVIILTTLVILGAVALASRLLKAPSVYTASATVRIRVSQGASASAPEQGNAERLRNTYAQLLVSRPFLEAVAQRLPPSTTRGTLSQGVTIASPANSELLVIGVEHTDPQRTAEIANALAALLVQQSAKDVAEQSALMHEGWQVQLSPIEEQLREDRASLVLVQQAQRHAEERRTALQELQARVQVEEQSTSSLLAEYERALAEGAPRAERIGFVEPALLSTTVVYTSSTKLPAKPSVTAVYTASALIRIADSQSSSADPNRTNHLRNMYAELGKGGALLQEAGQRLGLGIPLSTLLRMVSVESIADSELIRIRAQGANAEGAVALANALGDLLLQQRRKDLAPEEQDSGAREALRQRVAAAQVKLDQDRALLAPRLQDPPDPDRGAAIQELMARINLNEQTYAQLQSQYDRARADEAGRSEVVTVVEAAAVPQQPLRPLRNSNLALAVLVGLGGGLALALLLEALDTAVRSPEDLESLTCLPVLGRIPALVLPEEARDAVILLNSAAPSAAMEAFRVLGANTLPTLAGPAQTGASPTGTFPHTLMISSAEPNAGKSTVAANLAAALAHTGRRVVLVDADLRKPSVHQAFGLKKEPGVVDAILEPSRLVLALRDTGAPRLRVLSCGTLGGDPVELLASDGMREVLQNLAYEADIIILDTPPVLAAADAVLLAPLASEVLLVAAQGRSRKKEVRLALQQLQRAGARPLGLVLNKAKGRNGNYHPYDDYPAQSAPPAETKA